MSAGRPGFEHLEALRDLGAHFTLNNYKKAPWAHDFLKRSAAWEKVEKHWNSGGLVGTVPGLFPDPMVVVDLDYGRRQAVTDVLGPALAESKTDREDGWHLWYRAVPGEIKNREWEIPGERGASGEIRGTNGSLVIRRPEDVVRAFERYKDANALGPEDLAKLPRRKRRKTRRKANGKANGGAAHGGAQQSAEAIDAAPVAEHLHAALDYLAEHLEECSYQTWVNVGMALHHETEGRADGLKRWDEWSRAFGNYPGPGEPTTGDKWNSFTLGGDDEATITGGTIVAYAREIGWKGRVPRRGNGHANGHTHGNTHPATADGLEEALASIGIDVRFNVVAQHAEWRIDDRDWNPTNDRIRAWVRAELARRCFKKSPNGVVEWQCSDAKWRLFLDALLYKKEVDPFQVWLESLPEWDGTERCGGFFGKCWKLFQSTANVALARWASAFMFVGAVQRTFEPGCKLDQIPVLVGPIDLGKSVMGPWLLPTHLRAMFGDSLSLSARGKDRVEATLGKKIIEVAELAGSRIADVESMKAYLSRQVDYERLPYRHDPEHIPRRWIAFATTNREDSIPNDHTGNRRLVPIALKERNCRPEEVLDGFRDQLFAEALARYRRGERANLPSDLAPILATTSESHRHRESLEDLVEEYLGRGDEPGERDRISSEDVARTIGMLAVPLGAGERSFASRTRLRSRPTTAHRKARTRPATAGTRRTSSRFSTTTGRSTAC